MPNHAPANGLSWHRSRSSMPTCCLPLFKVITPTRSHLGSWFTHNTGSVSLVARVGTITGRSIVQRWAPLWGLGSLSGSTVQSSTNLLCSELTIRNSTFHNCSTMCCPSKQVAPPSTVQRAGARNQWGRSVFNAMPSLPPMSFVKPPTAPNHHQCGAFNAQSIATVISMGKWGNYNVLALPGQFGTWLTSTTSRGQLAPPLGNGINWRSIGARACQNLPTVQTGLGIGVHHQPPG